MFLSRTGAPVVMTVAFGKRSSAIVALIASDALPSSLIERFPCKRVTICACRSSGKFDSSGVRISPSLS